jgi:hypothetical protein
MKFSLPLLLPLLALLAAPAPAAVYYMQANETSTTLNAFTEWSSLASGAGGTNPSTFNDNEFVSQGFQLRTPTSLTFGNASTILRLAPNATDSKGLVLRGTNITIANVILEGGTIMSGADPAGMSSTNFTVSSSSFLRPNDFSTPRALTLTLANLTGSGALSMAGGGVVTLGVTTGTSYTGNLGFSGTTATTLSFTSSWISGGGLVVNNSNSRISLGQDVTFTSLRVNGVYLAADNYTAAELALIAPTIFTGTDLGSITVVPEPGAMVLLGLGVFFVRRRRISA